MIQRLIEQWICTYTYIIYTTFGHCVINNNENKKKNRLIVKTFMDHVVRETETGEFKMKAKIIRCIIRYGPN